VFKHQRNPILLAAYCCIAGNVSQRFFINDLKLWEDKKYVKTGFYLRTTKRKKVFFTSMLCAKW